MDKIILNCACDCGTCDECETEKKEEGSEDDGKGEEGE